MPGGLEILIEPKTRSILRTLQNSPGKIFHLNSLAKTSKVSVSSTARIIQKLVKKSYAEELKVGKWSVYKLVEIKVVKDRVFFDLIELKTNSILQTLLRNQKEMHHLNSLAESSLVPVSSTARIIRKLVKNGFAEELKIGKWSVYKLAENKQTELLKKLL